MQQQHQRLTSSVALHLSRSHSINAHAQQDLKPGNLLVDDRGVLKLSDFGLATVYVGPAKTYSHQVATRWYRAPELLFGSRQYDTAVDMWGVGAIFAELLRPVPLFSGQNDIDQLYRVIQVLGNPETQWPVCLLCTKSS